MGAEATVAFKALAEKEGVVGAHQEMACRGCRKFLGDIALDGRKATARIRCKCGTDNFLIIETDRMTVVAPPK